MIYLSGCLWKLKKASFHKNNSKHFCPGRIQRKINHTTPWVYILRTIDHDYILWIIVGTDILLTTLVSTQEILIWIIFLSYKYGHTGKMYATQGFQNIRDSYIYFWYQAIYIYIYIYISYYRFAKVINNTLRS